MSPVKMDGNTLILTLKNGAINLKNNSQMINDLNVFPVPDGDTGSNMYSTMNSGIQSIESLKDESVERVGKALSRGLLMGARGNSGVILSQLFSGFAKSFKDLVTANAVHWVEGMRLGVEQAYGAVINPVEGTILTVAREAAEKALEVAKADSRILEVMEIYLEEARASLKRTPDLLPVLKESGVVDSGGVGMVVIVEGMVAALKGEVYEEEKQKKPKPVKTLKQEDEDVDFGYCTEFIVQLEDPEKFNKDRFVKQLSRLGDSVVVVADEEICKVHIHTEKPGDALNIGQQYGEIANLKIENMTMQHTETLLHSKVNGSGEDTCGHDHGSAFRLDTKKKYGIITVVNGKGLKTMFREMGVSYVIDGGQTMNPSTQDFIDAVKQVNAENILIIPNNKNVFLSAQQASKSIEDKNVIVIPAKTIAQGYASLTMFDASQDVEAAVEEMESLIENVTSGEVTYAVRKTSVNGMKIAKGDFLGIKDGDIVVSEEERFATVKALIDQMVAEESEIITIMYGKDVEKDEVARLTEHIQKTHSALELETIDGQQPIYSYLIAVE